MTPHPPSPPPQPALVQGNETSPPSNETYTDVSHEKKGEALVVPPTTTTTSTTPLTTLSPTVPGGKGGEVGCPEPPSPTPLPTSNPLFESGKEPTQPKASTVAPEVSTLPPTEVVSAHPSTTSPVLPLAPVTTPAQVHGPISEPTQSKRSEKVATRRKEHELLSASSVRPYSSTLPTGTGTPVRPSEIVNPDLSREKAKERTVDSYFTRQKAVDKALCENTHLFSAVPPRICVDTPVPARQTPRGPLRAPAELPDSGPTDPSLRGSPPRTLTKPVTTTPLVPKISVSKKSTTTPSAAKRPPAIPVRTIN